MYGFTISEYVCAIDADCVFDDLLSESLPPDVSFSCLFINEFDTASTYRGSKPDLIVFICHWKIIRR